MNIKSHLSEFSLTPQNSIVIGSGILNALNIRESADIDLVVSDDTYKKLLNDSRLELGDTQGMEILKNKIFQIGKGWNVVDANKIFSFNELLDNSVVIDDVRYITLQFLLKIKKIWIGGTHKPHPIEKDERDVRLIEDYLKIHQSRTGL